MSSPDALLRSRNASEVRSRNASGLFYRLGSLSGSSLAMPLLERRRSTSASIFSDSALAESPLHDLPPLAVPGLITRVSRGNSIAFSLDAMTDAFEPGKDNIDTVTTFEGGDTVEVIYHSPNMGQNQASLRPP